MSAWVFRFIANNRASQEHRLDGPPTPDKIQNVEIRIIRDAQQTFLQNLVPFKETEPYLRKAD